MGWTRDSQHEWTKLQTLLFARISCLLYIYSVIIFLPWKNKNKYHSRSLVWWMRPTRMNQTKNATVRTFRVCWTYTVWSSFRHGKPPKKTTIHGAWYDENAQRAIANTNEPNGKRFCMFARIYPRLLYRYGMIIFPSRKTKKKLYHSRSLKWWKQLAREKQIKNLTACTYRVYCIWSFLPGRPENNTLQLGAWHDENASRDENASHDENQHERTK